MATKEQPPIEILADPIAQQALTEWKEKEPEFGRTLAELKRTALILPDLKKKIEALNVKDSSSYAQMGLYVQEARAISKQGELKLNPFKAVINRVKDYVQTKLKEHELEADSVAKIGADKQSEYNRLEREAAQREQDEIRRRDKEAAEKRAAEQKKADEQAAKERKEKRIAEIRAMLKKGEIGKREAEKLLREAGATEEADKAKAAADAEQVATNVPQRNVLPNKVTVAGQRARAPLVYEITDISRIPRELLYPNPDQKTGKWKPEDFPRLNKAVREASGEKSAEATAGGGIRCWRDDRV